MSPARPVKLFFDGGCRPNPGRMECAVVARGITHHRGDLGPGTSSHAEWLALLHALEVARAIGASDLQLLGDSRFVVGQANGAKIRGADFAEYRARFVRMAEGFARVRVRHVPRSHNLAGIALERMCSGL